jgi:hypothetical protein
VAHVERSCVQLAGERQLQDRCLAIVQEMSQRVLRVEQLVALSRQTTILQKTLRSGGDSDFSARMVDEQAERFGGRIQSILDRIVYPSGSMEPRDLVGQEG